MRTKEEIQENNYQLLKQLILNTIDIKETHSFLSELKLNRKSYLREHCTVKFGSSRCSGHSTGMFRCLFDLDIDRKHVLCLYPKKSHGKIQSHIFQNVSTGIIISPFGEIINIKVPKKEFLMEFGSFNKLDSHRGMNWDIIIVDLYSFLSKTGEDELYDFASLSGTELMIFLQ